MATETAKRRRSPAKRAAITEAALRVFLREGYTRASVDAIAADAGVSKRTVYNHFRDKEALFATIVAESSTAVAEDFTEVAARHLDAPADAASALAAFGLEWASPSSRRPDHGALVRLLMAEATHFPDIIRVWQETGPEPVYRGLAARLRAMADRGLLSLAEGEEEAATGHFVALVQTPATNRSFFHTLPLPEAEHREIVRSGVDAFLRLYGPR
ncbi:TetR/AcrR family transcriptional regulator [Nocardiopsis halotolerans]|uniref:TetR/AcrR family transcriptional regulator n=1 Tax=Nocardiopsis halotolerans TaxID=124252 RepID=UPI0003786CAD|nr:TetR/AcrR family transcriptional regulator [Nocardiopsis halotolerans]